MTLDLSIDGPIRGLSALIETASLSGILQYACRSQLVVATYHISMKLHLVRSAIRLVLFKPGYCLLRSYGPSCRSGCKSPHFSMRSFVDGRVLRSPDRSAKIVLLHDALYMNRDDASLPSSIDISPRNSSKGPAILMN